MNAFKGEYIDKKTVKWLNEDLDRLRGWNEAINAMEALGGFSTTVDAAIEEIKARRSQYFQEVIDWDGLAYELDLTIRYNKKEDGDGDHSDE